ncbi:MAG: hypothetical protein ACTHJ5_13920 [Ilyomonas sp.]
MKGKKQKLILDSTVRRPSYSWEQGTRVRCLLLIVSIITATFIHAQQFGATSASVKWRQINTDTVRVIFPQGLDSIAQRIAALAAYEASHDSNTIGNHLRKIDIVLRNRVTYSNGYVSLAPYRSEFYLQPSINAFELGAQSMADNLTLHEFRHVEQYSNFRKGLSKAMYFLFGEGGQALANAAAVPDWFFEGDAVYNETWLSRQGRGRIPYFFNGYKSLFDAGKHYSYMKLRNGSYKDFIPGHYELGYLLTAYGREKYGMDIWKKVTDDAVRFKPIIYPWQNAVKKYTGVSYKQFVSDAFDFYQTQWKNDTSYKTQWITKTEHNNVVNYNYPYLIEDGSILVLKNSYKKLPSFIKINTDNSETKIATQSITYHDYFSYNNGCIVYSSYQPDKRWGYHEYSVIRIVDISSGKEKKITSQTKYFTPDISHNRKFVAAVSIYPDQTCSVDILNDKGRMIKRLIKDNKLLYSYPKFSDDDGSLFLMARDPQGEMSLQKINIENGFVETLLPFKNRILGFPTVKGDTIFYSCSNNGKDEIWATIISSNKTYRIADFATGLYQSIADASGDIIASAFTAEGYRIGKFSPRWEQVEANDTLQALYVTSPFNTVTNNALEAAPQTRNYTVTNYSKWSHPFNFHSWQPSVSDPDYSFTLFGENVLNTLQSQVYYTYNRNEAFSRIGLSTIYGGWYIEPFIGINETFGRKFSRSNDTTFDWNEFKTSAGLQLPLNFSGGKYYRSLSLSSTFNINNVQWTGLAKQLLKNSTVDYVESRLSFTNQIQKAKQNIYPRWAQSASMQLRNSIGNVKATQFLARADFYLPGVFINHNLVISGAWQKTDTLNNYVYPNNFPFSRGYDQNYRFPIMWRLSASYHFPLLYPDWGFGNLLYFQRIRGIIFYDHTGLKNTTTFRKSYYTFRSAGCEIYFDTRWWNQQQVTFGFRYSRLFDAKQQPNQWEFILPVNLFTP